MKNSFQNLQDLYEAKFDAQASIEFAIQQNLVTAKVISQFAELYIPHAAGAFIKISTGSDTRTQPMDEMPQFDWRYKITDDALPTCDDPRNRFGRIPPMSF